MTRESEEVTKPHDDTEEQQEGVVLEWEQELNVFGESRDPLMRKGTITSARFNIWSTMVGGGSLSLPFAFEKAGNALMAPIMLIVVALLSEFCFGLLIKCAPPPCRNGTRGTASFESVASNALGVQAHRFCTFIVVVLCFMAAVGYCVLVRDMLEPVTDFIFPTSSRLYYNISMFAVVLIVTPLCGLQTLTSLQKFGAAGMMAVLVLGSCVVFRSGQCNIGSLNTTTRLFPENPWFLLDALPIFISCYVCHYNILPCYNDMQNPTPKRISWWLRSTTWTATVYYIIIGTMGSLYANCTESKHVQGNILLDFDEDDPVLFVGRMCLAFTVSMAFPMLVIPIRDIVLKAREDRQKRNSATLSEGTRTNDLTGFTGLDLSDDETPSGMEEPLLMHDDNDDEVDDDESRPPQRSIWLRLSVSILVFWSAAFLACFVSSIDIVWDFSGSSLSMFLSYLIPAASFLALTRQDEHAVRDLWSRVLCWVLILVTTPIMFLSTGYAIYSVLVPESS